MLEDRTPTRTLHLDANEASPQRARHFVREVLHEWQLAPIEFAQLVMSEAVAHAVIDGTQREIVVRVRRLDGPAARIEVNYHDRRPIDIGDEHTRTAFRLIEAIADDWGVDDVEGDSATLWIVVPLHAE
jgi:hypothetical protein